jgi:hypothetical protein
MFNEKTGGPAFPGHHSDYAEGEHGMTLRDYFAAQAMQGMLSVPGIFQIIADLKISEKNVATASYEWADAMLKARAQNA